MAHFAEVNSDGIVLRVVRSCGQDIVANGGDCSEQAAENFKKICPLSKEGVKWIQTSKKRTFRKNYAGIGMKYDEQKDAFIGSKPYDSWVLNEDTRIWEPPIEFPNNITFGDDIPYTNIIWKENLQKWFGYDTSANEFEWISGSKSWLSTGRVVPKQDR
jgi:hypothetical protein